MKKFTRNLFSQENRDYWDFVEKIATKVNNKRKGFWIHGDTVGSLTRYYNYIIPKPVESMTMEEIDIFRKFANKTLDIMRDESLDPVRKAKAKEFYELTCDLVGDMLARYRKEHGI